MAEFDTIAKDLIHAYPGDFARFALQRDDLHVGQVITPEQPDITTHQTDSLIPVRIGDEKALVHCEFQTTDSDPPMPYRMAAYIGRAVHQHRIPIYSNVIYLRPDAGRRDPGHYLQEQHGYRVLIQYKVIRLAELDGQRLLEAGAAGLLPFAPLMQPPDGVDAEGWLRRCVQQTQATVPDAAQRARHLTELAVLSGLVYHIDVIRTIISEEIMYESSVVQYFAERALKQGLEQGIEQGIEQGGRERAVEDLLDVLEIRFGLAASDPLAARLAAIDDVQRLKQLHRAAIQVASLEAFQDLLHEAGSTAGRTARSNSV